MLEASGYEQESGELLGLPLVAHDLVLTAVHGGFCVIMREYAEGGRRELARGQLGLSVGVVNLDCGWRIRPQVVVSVRDEMRLASGPQRAP